jgi:hypothetical protein
VATSGTHSNDNTNFCLGAEGARNVYPFTGELRNLRIWATAIDPAATENVDCFTAVFPSPPPSPPKCWITLPTGCDRTLGETSTPEVPFVDPHRNDEASCLGSRKSAYNTYCTKTDAVAVWAASLAPLPPPPFPPPAPSPPSPPPSTSVSVGDLPISGEAFSLGAGTDARLVVPESGMLSGPAVNSGTPVVATFAENTQSISTADSKKWFACIHSGLGPSWTLGWRW